MEIRPRLMKAINECVVYVQFRSITLTCYFGYHTCIFVSTQINLGGKCWE